MAPMAIENPPSSKRTSSTAEFETSVAKRRNLGLLQHHKPIWDSNSSRRFDAPCQDGEVLQSLLTRSIGLALDAVGFEAAEPVAMESFRAEVEEYMTHFLATVRQSMLSCRRTQPIPQDFLHSLHAHQLSLTSLIPHLDPPVLPSRSQIGLEVELETAKTQPFLGATLIGISDACSKPYIPRHFPPFPSTHTYKATPEIPHREKDPRKMRELLTEEGRLGEEALRRFLGAGSDHISKATSQTRSAPKNVRAMRDQLWRETMLAVSQDSDPRLELSDDNQVRSGKLKEQELGNQTVGKGHLSFAVNADKRYWRQSSTTHAARGDSSVKEVP